MEFTILLNLSDQEAHIYIATVAGYRGALTGAQNHRKFRKICNQVENLATLEDPMPLRIQHSRIGLHYTEKACVQSRSENHHVILTSTLYIRSASATAAAVPVSSRTVSEGDSLSDFMRKKRKEKTSSVTGSKPSLDDPSVATSSELSRIELSKKERPLKKSIKTLSAETARRLHCNRPRISTVSRTTGDTLRRGRLNMQDHHGETNSTNSSRI